MSDKSQVHAAAMAMLESCSTGYAKLAAQRDVELWMRLGWDTESLTVAECAAIMGDDNVVPLHKAANDTYAMTFFPDQYAKSMTVETLALHDLANRIVTTTASEKAKLPYVKFATFNGKVNPNNPEAECLRYDAGVVEITGIEGDKDDAPLGFDEAGDELEAVGIHALLYTSASHTEEKPRFRVIAPTSRPLPHGEREKLMARLNGVLDGALSPESFTLSQSYNFGSVKDTPVPRIHIVRGRRYIDQCADLDAGAIGKGQTAKAKTAKTDDYYSDSKWANFADQQSKTLIDVDQALADMWHHDGHGNIHKTQLSVIAALLCRGVSANEAGERVLARTMEVTKETEEHQVKRLQGMIKSWLRKHPELKDTAYPKGKEKPLERIEIEAYTFPPEQSLERYDWLLGRHLLRGQVCGTVASGGTGKSSQSIASKLWQWPAVASCCTTPCPRSSRSC
jgi:hypothetical protein